MLDINSSVDLHTSAMAIKIPSMGFTDDNGDGGGDDGHIGDDDDCDENFNDDKLL